MGVPHLVVQVSTKRVDAEDEEGDAGVADDLHVPHLDEALEGVPGAKEVGERERTEGREEWKGEGGGGMSILCRYQLVSHELYSI